MIQNESMCSTHYLLCVCTCYHVVANCTLYCTVLYYFTNQLIQNELAITLLAPNDHDYVFYYSLLVCVKASIDCSLNKFD